MDWKTSNFCNLYIKISPQFASIVWSILNQDCLRYFNWPRRIIDYPILACLQIKRLVKRFRGRIHYESNKMFLNSTGSHSRPNGKSSEFYMRKLDFRCSKRFQIRPFCLRILNGLKKCIFSNCICLHWRSDINFVFAFIRQ